MKTGRSIGAKVTLICAACLGVVILAAAGHNAVLVRSLKEQMLSDSHRLIEEAAEHLSEDISRAMNEAAANADSAAHGASKENVNAQLKLFLRRYESVQFVVPVEQNKGGEPEAGEFRDEAARRQFEAARGEWLKHPNPGPDSAPAGEPNAPRNNLRRRDEISTLTALRTYEARAGGVPLLYAVNESKTLKQIEAAGTEITRRVTIMTATLSLALVSAFFAVWILFRGQERLVVENERLDRMAYTGTLASGLAHEIRNPLNAMSVNLGVVREDLDDPRPESPERVKEIVQHLRAEVSQLNQVVTNFLSFAFPRSTARTPVRLAATIRETLDSLQTEFEARRVKTAVELDESVEIEGDPLGLRQAFHNLALNAAQAMTGPRRRLRVRLWREGAKARLLFEDSGEGIAAAEVARIFEVFQTTKASGSGFGLPIAQRIVLDHAGRIWAESAAGRGSAFHLEFPLRPPQKRS